MRTEPLQLSGAPHGGASKTAPTYEPLRFLSGSHATGKPNHGIQHAGSHLGQAEYGWTSPSDRHSTQPLM